MDYQALPTEFLQKLLDLYNEKCSYLYDLMLKHHSNSGQCIDLTVSVRRYELAYANVQNELNKRI